MYLWICYFRPVILQRCNKFTLVLSSKLSNFAALSDKQSAQLNKAKKQNIQSICGKQLVWSLRAHQYSWDEIQIWRTGVFQLLVETRVFSRDEISRYRLWLLLLITRELNLTKLRKDLTINLWTAAVPLFETSSIQLRSNADLERTDCSNYC